MFRELVFEGYGYIVERGKGLCSVKEKEVCELLEMVLIFSDYVGWNLWFLWIFCCEKVHGIVGSFMERWHNNMVCDFYGVVCYFCEDESCEV